MLEGTKIFNFVDVIDRKSIWSQRVALYGLFPVAMARIPASIATKIRGIPVNA
jgi:hypothetical protein